MNFKQKNEKKNRNDIENVQGKHNYLGKMNTKFKTIC